MCMPRISLVCAVFGEIYTPCSFSLWSGSGRLSWDYCSHSFRSFWFYFFPFFSVNWLYSDIIRGTKYEVLPKFKRRDCKWNIFISSTIAGHAVYFNISTCPFFFLVQVESSAAFTDEKPMAGLRRNSEHPSYPVLHSSPVNLHLLDCFTRIFSYAEQKAK